MVLTRTSCHKIAQANGYCGAWPGWVVSVFVSPNTAFLESSFLLQKVYHCCSVTMLCLTLPDPKDCSMPGFPVPHHLSEFAPSSCPLYCWSHLTILFSVTLFCFCLQSFRASGSFPMSRLVSSDGQSIGASASVLPMSIRSWFPLRLTGLISLLSRGLSRVFSSTIVWKHQFFSALPSFWSSSHNDTWLLERPYPWLCGPCQ